MLRADWGNHLHEIRQRSTKRRVSEMIYANRTFLVLLTSQGKRISLKRKFRRVMVVWLLTMLKKGELESYLKNGLKMSKFLLTNIIMTCIL